LPIALTLAARPLTTKMMIGMTTSDTSVVIATITPTLFTLLYRLGSTYRVVDGT
jgi:hypothetical protein